MLKQLLIILTLSLLVNGSKIGIKNTETKVGRLYNPSELFMKTSFLKIDICKKFTNRKSFITYLLKTGIICTGKWCNGNYKYDKVDNSYEVEHIIELQNSELNNCNKNIYGNIILAYGKWNRQVGNLDWKNGKQEKERIYGRNIVKQALENIKKCDSSCNEPLPEIGYIFMYIAFIVILVGIVIGNIMHLSKSCCVEQKHNTYNEWSEL